MSHMSEKEWAVFAADKHIDANTGGALKAPSESGMNDHDFHQIMGAIREARSAIERTQLFMGVGFAAIALLIAWLR